MLFSELFDAKMLFSELSDAKFNHFNKAYADYEALKSPTPEHLPPHYN